MYLQTSFFPDAILRQNAPISDTFEIASRNLVLFSGNSRGSYLGRYVVKISKYLVTLFFSDTILCRNALTSDAFEIASRNLVLFSSNSRGSYVGRCVVKISKYQETPFFPTRFCAKTLRHLTVIYTSTSRYLVKFFADSKITNN